MNRQQQRGVVAIVSLIFIFILFGLTGMAIDIGVVQSRRTLEQTAADAAATAGAMEIAAGRTSTAVAAAKAAAKLNGFTDGQSNIAVTVNTTSSTADVTISQALPLYFLPVLGLNSMTIAARATGSTGGSGGSGTAQGSGCVYALGSAENPGLEMDGTLNANCDVVVNSTQASNSVKWDSNAACVVTTDFLFNGVMNLYPGTSSSTQTSWTYNQNNQWYQQGGCSTNYGSYKTFYQVPSPGSTPVATMMTTTVADPLASLDQTALEALQTCNALTTSSKAGVSIDYNSAPNLGSAVTYTGSGSNMVVTINPGVYCGGLTLGSQTTFKMNPGVYSIRGGSFTVNSQAKVTGTGITMYLSTPVTSLTNYDQTAHVNISGQPVVQISGGDGTNSTVKDVAFWVNRNAGSSEKTDSFNGASTSYVNGSIYAPVDHVLITGNGSLGNTNLTLGAVNYGSCYGSTYLIGQSVQINGKAGVAVSKNSSQCSSGSGGGKLTF